MKKFEFVVILRSVAVGRKKRKDYDNSGFRKCINAPLPPFSGKLKLILRPSPP
jgi:hypothetical protein